jgi:hypothetical protein
MGSHDQLRICLVGIQQCGVDLIDEEQLEVHDGNRWLYLHDQENVWLWQPLLETVSLRSKPQPVPRPVLGPRQKNGHPPQDFWG